MKFDKVNRTIVKQLLDGRRSFAEIAKSLSVTTNTVRSRVSKLVRKGVLDIKGLVNPDEINDHFMVIIGVNLHTTTLFTTGEAFRQLRGVVSAAVVTGRFDLILVVLLNSEFGINEFYTQEVSKIKEVRSTETFVVYKNFDFKVPYVL